MDVLSSIRIVKTYAINLCHNLDDFGVDAEWIFFATSHEKSPCDGIGSFVKTCFPEELAAMNKCKLFELV